MLCSCSPARLRGAPLVLTLMLGVSACAGNALPRTPVSDRERDVLTPVPSPGSMLTTLTGLSPTTPPTCTVSVADIACECPDGVVALALERGSTVPRSVTRLANRLCGLASDGTVTCWDHDSICSGAARATQVPLPPITQLAPGPDNMCALAADGSVHCWGSLGDGVIPEETPRRQALSPAIAIAAGSGNACAVAADGGVFCWGHFYGTVPIRLTGLDDIMDLSAESHGRTCALSRNGRVRCWLVGGAPPEAPRFASDVPILRALDIDSSSSFTCAITQSHALECFGIAMEALLSDDRRAERNATSCSGPWRHLRHLVVVERGVEAQWLDYDGTLMVRLSDGRVLCNDRNVIRIRGGMCEPMPDDAVPPSPCD